MAETEGLTICAMCHYAPSDARYRPWWEWLCMAEAAKLPSWMNPVTGQNVADPPRLRCKVRNTGQCPDWKETHNVFGLKVTKKQGD